MKRPSVTILITGGLGFIGLHLIRLVLRKYPDWSLRILDNESVGRREDLACLLDEEFPGERRGIERDRLDIISGDICDTDCVKHATKGCDSVVHLAASTGVHTSIQNPAESVRVNALGTLNVLEAARKKQVRRVVLASSNAAAGEPNNSDYGPFCVTPVSPYGAGKLCLEALASAYWRSMELETVCLRFANVYGPYSGRKSSVVAKWISRILNGEPVEIYGDGSQTRDFVWAGDIAQAIVSSLESPHAPGEIFQIGSGESISILQLVERLRKVSGLDFPVEFVPAPPGEIQRVRCDMRHARHLLGLSELTPIEYGLPKTWAWFARR